MELPRPESRVSTEGTLLDYGTATAARLLGSAGMDVEQGRAVLRGMLSPWGERPISRRPDWHSDVCADGSPIEFSAAFSDRCTQIRVLVEAVPDELTTPGAQKSALALTRVLIEDFGAADGRLAAVSDLFLPDEDPTGFAMMHAAVFTPAGEPEFKIYLNPNANSRMTGRQRTREALESLGFGKAWDAVVEYARRGFDLDRIVYFGLDLSEGPESRVKVYFRHYDIAPADLDACMEIAASHEPGLLGGFCRTLTGRVGAIRDQPLVSNLTFTDAGGCAPVSATAYVPLWLYAESDRAARDRISSVMADVGLSDDRYRSLLNHMARRTLSDGRGIHTYASVRVHRGRPRMTTYWSSELYDRYPPARYQRG
ncbi:tryptophan dimethylallyltransferase family protein [Streptomyces sp. HNM0663]|uniref:Tryptophan dimethylallyltransferase family protein n=1 Tax=Streptomyces chengmaiensis TaxID=3040919 RepID=A0ABT6HHZ3_9ACTN|nr:tryptophan dimethylallyltransferase family protein [Streptomyces chengmaiensis]MDH2388376.1 tryptophan dimethylallyltransferase family protein [Streptomyces chengmaiensis]